MNDDITCPTCKHTDSAMHWDANTKYRLGLIDDVETHLENPDYSCNYLSINGDREFMEEVKAEYYCPICGEVIPGTDVIRSR